jgi:molybdate transport system ATP-binding protein
MGNDARALGDALLVRISLRVGDFVLDVNFDVAPGITVLFGPSGAGKTTTLAAVAGLVAPHAGRVALGERPWFDAALGVDVQPHRRPVSLVFQTLALFPHLSALANVEYGIDRRVARAERRERARSMLARMKVAHVAERRPSTFSGGEAQRVALARAFARSPRVVLLDEAFSSLDRELRRDLARDVRTLVDELAVPAILVTHHHAEARAMGERAVLLHHGKVVAAGSVLDVIPALADEG